MRDDTRKADTHLPQEKGTGTTPTSGGKARLRLRSTTLFTHNREVIIEHEGEEYRLRLTSRGKLILTK